MDYSFDFQSVFRNFGPLWDGLLVTVELTVAANIVGLTLGFVLALLVMTRWTAVRWPVMLFDEVTSALDPELVAEVEQVILQLASQDMPMVIVTHDMWFAKNIASRVIFCAGGVVVEDGPPEQVLGSPREERTREFIERVFHIKH